VVTIAKGMPIRGEEVIKVATENPPNELAK
jgi:hypothetical protein